MINIIKKGNTKTTILCPICSCLFSYENEDINKILFRPTRFKLITFNVIFCPECKQNITVSKKFKTVKGWEDF